MNTPLQFPSPGRRPELGASRFQAVLLKAKYGFGWLLWKAGVPGFLKDFETVDLVTGAKISVRTGPLFTRIGFDGRDYYFRRFSGRFDGTGTGCGN